MHRRLKIAFLTLLVQAIVSGTCLATEKLTVVAEFEGGSVRVLEIDDAARSVSFMLGGNPAHGWPCWWYFRIDGMTPGESITLQLRGSAAALGTQKPLSASWAMPNQATWSSDGKTWRHTDQGERQGEWMIYTLRSEAASAYVAWGPPYTPSTAAAFVGDLSRQSPHASATELCRSEADRSVPMLHVREGQRKSSQRFGVWVQARQHAWECGSSWVAHGFGEWLVTDEPDAAWLRQHADIFVVPIMDIDNTATGNGGKNALPHDHNRDWSEMP